MRETDGIRRTNRWDKDKGMLQSGKLDWVNERIIACAGLRDSAGLASLSTLSFRSKVDFSLIHEFNKGGYFDWHVDTRPGDGSGRTINVNVMLSNPAHDFSGGAFRVGVETIDVAQGDLYWYPASHPHAVDNVTAGRRRTLVVAVVDPRTVNEPSVQARLQAEDMRILQGRSKAMLYEEPLRAKYWRVATANFESLASGALKGDEKVRLMIDDHRAAMSQQDAAAPIAAPSPVVRAPSASLSRAPRGSKAPLPTPLLHFISGQSGQPPQVK